MYIVIVPEMSAGPVVMSAYFVEYEPLSTVAREACDTYIVITPANGTNRQKHHQIF